MKENLRKEITTFGNGKTKLYQCSLFCVKVSDGMIFVREDHLAISFLKKRSYKIYHEFIESGFARQHCQFRRLSLRFHCEKMLLPIGIYIAKFIKDDSGN